LPDVRLERTLTTSDQHELSGVDRIDRAHNIRGQIVADADISEVLSLARRDIRDFSARHGNRDAKKSIDSRIETVDLVIPVTMLQRRFCENPLSTGKEKYVKPCKYQASIDVAGGCVSDFIPYPAMNPSFDGTRFIGFFSDPFAECGYPCYATRSHAFFPKTLRTIDTSALENSLKTGVFIDNNRIITVPGGIKRLRLAKNVEALSKYSLDVAAQILGVARVAGTRAYCPTKFFEFDTSNPIVREIADDFVQTHSTLSYSTGWNRMEEGPCAHGCTNEWRLEQARETSRYGIITTLTVMIDASLGIDERLHRIKDIVRSTKIDALLLPIRPWEREKTERNFGVTWETLTRSKTEVDFDGNSLGRGYRLIEGGGGALVCHEIHPEILELVGDNQGRIRLCHHDTYRTFCASCADRGLGGIVCKTIHIRPPKEKQRNTPYRYKRRDRAKQDSLKFPREKKRQG